MKKTKRIISLLLVLILLLPSSTSASATSVAAEETEVTRVEEVVELRETNSETYLMSDGTYECVVFLENKYYRDSNDTLKLIDNTLVAASSGTGLMAATQYKNAANAFDITLSGSGTPEVSIDYNGAGITFSSLGAAKQGTMHMTASDCVVAIGAVENCAALDQLTATGSNTATYTEAFPATDLVYVLDNDALKEYIILKNSSAPNEFSFLFELDGLTMQTVDGFTHFVNANGEAVFTLGSLFAVDANGKPTDALTYSFVPVKGNANQVVVTVTLDEDYLTAADRAYPVVIDPTITVSSSETADTCVCSNFASTNYYLATQLRTGYEPDYGIRRSYLRFNIPDSIEPGSITNATLDLEKVSGVVPTVVAKRVTGSWTSSTLTWSNKPGETSEGQSSQSVVFREGSAWYTMNVTSIVNSWVNGYSLNYGFVLIDNTENNANHWTTFYSSDANSPHKPELIISYSDPAVITPPPSDPECTYLALNNYTTSMQIGQSLGFTVNAKPAGVAVTWTSSNTNVATVNAAGIVTAHYPGYTTIKATSGSKFAQCEVKVSPAGGFDHTITVTNYYDIGFTVRNGDTSAGIIINANQNAASRLGGIFSLDLVYQNIAYTSVADECKINTNGGITSSSINNVCTHAANCSKTKGMRDALINDVDVGSAEHSKVLWTGHSVPSSDESNSESSTHTVIIVPSELNMSHVFMHELSHQLGTVDHYCKDPDNGDCSNVNCDTCYKGRQTVRFCLMSSVFDTDDYGDDALYCTECLGVIRNHLDDHH